LISPIALKKENDQPSYSFPEQEFFHNDVIQQMMTDILFVWCKENDDISYRQGMHELLALVFFVVEMDKIVEVPKCENEEELLSDSFFLFLSFPWVPIAKQGKTTTESK